MDIKLENGNLTIAGLDTDKMRALYNKFRVDLLDENIIHYRPVAFKMEGPLSTTVTSNISKIPGFGYSFSELSFILSNIITFEKRGIMPEQLNATASLSRLKSDCSYILMSGKTIGTEEPESMFYCGEGMNAIPNMLLKDVSIFKNLRTSINIVVVLMRGKGKSDFDDNQRLIYGSGFKSMRTHYSLYNYFYIREYTGGDTIHLEYKEEINEDVLRDILKAYFEQEEVLECLR